MEIEDKKQKKLNWLWLVIWDINPLKIVRRLNSNSWKIMRWESAGWKIASQNKSGESLSAKNIGQAVVAELASEACYLFLKGQEFEACCRALIYN